MFCQLVLIAYGSQCPFVSVGPPCPIIISVSLFVTVIHVTSSINVSCAACYQLRHRPVLVSSTGVREHCVKACNELSGVNKISTRAFLAYTKII